MRDREREPEGGAGGSAGGGSFGASGDATSLLAKQASDQVRALAAALSGLQAQEVSGGLLAGAQLSADVISLARLRHVLDRETARRVHVAATNDVLHTGAVTALRQQRWSSREAQQATVAAAFADAWPELALLWSRGAIGADIVHALAVGTRPLTREQTRELLQTLLPRLPHLQAPDVRRVVRHAVELLRPCDGDAKEQDDYDRRFLAWSTHKGVVCLTGELPALEGEAFKAAIDALAESQRAEGDGLTKGQRRADALASLVARAAAGGRLPAAAGLPAAASIVIGLNEAERIANGRRSSRRDSLLDAAQAVGGTRQGAVGEPDATLGDAAARFLLCAAELTGVIVASGGTHTEGHGDCSTGQAGDVPIDHGGVAGCAPSDPHGPLATALGLTRLEPLAVGRQYRFATTHQRKALALRNQTCFLAGCSIPATECQPHHVTDWAAGGHADLGNLVSACWSHHRQLDLGRIQPVRNPDPDGPYWIGRIIPRSRWRRRQ